jgi:SAM-dependent methyltransferase
MTGSPPLTGERTAPGIASENYWFRRHVAAYRLAAARVGGHVIDAGCGEGYGTEILARQARIVVGLDLDQPTLAHARESYPQTHFVRGDVSRFPFEVADAVVCLQVLEHLEDPDGFLEACASVLRPGGTLVLSTPNRLTFPAGINPFHVHEFDPGELAALVGRRFSEVHLHGISHGPGLRLLDRSLGEPVQHRLVRTPYRELPMAVRTILRMVTARSFVLTSDAERALDLFAVCRNTSSSASP